MKPTIALRTFLLGSAIATLFTVPATFAQTWDGGGADNSTLTANNWNPNTVPTGGTGTLTFAGSVRPSVVWNGVNSVAPVNFYGMTFAAGASAFTINAGTQTSFQFTNPGNSSIILNSSSNLQTLKPLVFVFFNGTKTIDGGTAGLALDGGISFRADGLTGVQNNKLTLTGTANSTTSSIGQLGAYTPGATNSLTKTGSGKWTVAGDATYVGTTTISVGTLEFGGSISSSSIANNAAMILNNTGSNSYANNITGSGTLTKNGAGTFTLSGTNSHAGATNVNDGTLLINGSISTSIVTVGIDGTLGGNNGTIGGATTVNGTLAAGNSVGTLSFSNTLSLGATSTYLFELNNTTNVADLTNVTGTLDIANGAVLDLEQLGAYALGDKFTLFSYSGLLTGNFDGLIEGAEFIDAGGSWKIAYADTLPGSNGGSGTSFVTITAIPEPKAAMLGALGLLALLRRRR